MTKDFQYIIVGSGVATVTVAKRLLGHDRNSSVRIFEAGPKFPRQNRRHWWNFVTTSKYKEDRDRFVRAMKRPYLEATYDMPNEVTATGNPGWYFHDARMLAYGGSTVHWGGWALRFKPEDFEMHSRTGLGVDWPLSYNDLESYYCEAEEFLSVSGDSNEDWDTADSKMRRSKPYPLPPFPWSAPEHEMADSFRKVGITPGVMPISRYRRCMTTGTCKYCPFDARFSADQILDELVADQRHSNLVFSRAPVVRVVSDSRERVSGVEFLNQQGETEFAGGENVIVAGGTYDSPKLLAASVNQWWEKGIGNDHDLVGRFLVSHSMLRVRGTRQGNPERWLQEYDFPNLMSRTYDSPEYQRQGKILLFNNRKLPDFDLAGRMIDGRSKSGIIEELEGSRQMEVQAFYEEKGRFENRILCDGATKTRFSLPATKVHFTRTPEARAEAEKWMEKMKEVIKAAGYKFDRAKIYTPGGHHSTGTCRMSTTPEEGVTDSSLRVHGVNNLYVCSNAAFPTVSAVNPTLTLTALAMRLGDHLIGPARCSDAGERDSS